MERRRRTNLVVAATAAAVLATVLSAVTTAADKNGGPGGPALQQAGNGQSGGQAAAEKPKKEQSGGQAAAETPKQKKDPVARFQEPWPDAEKLRERKAEAEKLPLFSSAEPVTVTLAADFKTVNKDRDPKSTKTYQAQFTIPAAGATKTVKATIGGRGILRRKPQVCSFIPLRLAFAKADVKDTPFDGLDHVKLVTHCQKDYEHYVLGEHLAYLVFNLFTPLSYRTRLAKVTYVDALTGKPMDTRWGMFVEDQDDVAKRAEGRAVELVNKHFSQLVPDALLRQMVLQYMIGNTDISIYLLHNMRLIQTPKELRLYPISYDFDLAGLVNAPYGAPDKRLPITSIRDRYYRGPCVTAEELEPILAEFRAKKAESLALVDTIPDIDRQYRQSAKDYLEGFFSTINNKGATKRAFIDGCKDRPFM